MNSVASTIAVVIPLIVRIRTAMPESVSCWPVVVLFMPIRLQDKPAKATNDFGHGRQLFVRQALLWLQKLIDNRIGLRGLDEERLTAAVAMSRGTSEPELLGFSLA